MPGNWSDAERKSVEEKKDVFDTAVKEIKSKFGADWSVVVDWATIAACGGLSESSRRSLGDTVISNVVARFVSDDLKRMEPEVFVALNAYCKKKQLTISAGEKGGVFEANRGAVACEPSKVKHSYQTHT